MSCDWPILYDIENEVAAELDQAAAMFAGDFGDHGLRLGVGHATDYWHAGFDDSGFFAGD